MITNKPNGAIYTGMTGNLAARVWQHQSKTVPGFSQKYKLSHLVYYEFFEDVHAAIQREKRLKHWGRDWKIALIEKRNPHWHDLSGEILC
jgi:putative endonuclease